MSMPPRRQRFPARGGRRSGPRWHPLRALLPTTPGARATRSPPKSADAHHKTPKSTSAAWQHPTPCLTASRRKSGFAMSKTSSRRKSCECRGNTSRFHKSLSLRRHFILLPDSPQPSRHPRSRRVSARGSGRGGLGLGATVSNGAKRFASEFLFPPARGTWGHPLLASPVPLSFSLALRLGTGFGAAAAGGGETWGLQLCDCGGSARTRCRAWCPRLFLSPRALRRVQGRVRERGEQCCVVTLQALLRLCWQGFRPAVVWLVLPTPAADAVCLGARQDVSRIRPGVG